MKREDFVRILLASDLPHSTLRQEQIHAKGVLRDQLTLESLSERCVLQYIIYKTH